MPYSIRKLPNKDLYRVYNTKTKEVHSYATTLENAKKQVKLLHMIDAGVEVSGGDITDIDRTSTGVIRVKLNDPAKNFLTNNLIPLISNTTIRITDSRKNSGLGRSQVFGYGNIRGKGFGEFKNNTNYPELYRALLIFGMKIVPDYIPFTAIQVNHNYKTKKHIDGNNIGLSLAVSFGDFTGGELVIGKSSYQTKEYPVIFNGALTEHFNKPIRGNRYSLVYFVSAPKKYSDEDVYKLHKKTISSIKIMKGEGLIGGSIETDKFENEGIVSLPEFRSVKLKLPTYMYKKLPNIKGKPPTYKYRLVIPITSSRNLSSRKNETSLNITQKPVSRPIIDITESQDEPKLEDFSPADRLKLQQYYYNVKQNENKNPDTIDNDNYEIKERGRPLPCQNARPKQPKQPKSPKQPIQSIVDFIPPPSAKVVSSKASSVSSKSPTVTSSSSVASSVETDNDDLQLYLRNREEYNKKYGLGIKNNILSNNKMANSWITYVKEFASKNGMSYRDALRDPKCKEGYKKGGAVCKRGKGVVDEMGDQDLIAEVYNDSELGANGDKKYISL